MRQRRRNLPGYWAPFTLMALSGLPHAPWSVALHCTIGVGEGTRDFLRTMDVFSIITCAGAHDPYSWVGRLSTQCDAESYDIRQVDMKCAMTAACPLKLRAPASGQGALRA